MESRLFIIGNGFDLAHNLPTSFSTNFKKIAEQNEANREFWELYQVEVPDMWADFEHGLARPDFNSLEEIFNGYAPDYTSDRESDRNAIITQADINGNLRKSLRQFAEQADNDILNHTSLIQYKNRFNANDYFINFNYTHTLEKLYGINKNNIVHVHGEVGKDNLILGYPSGTYNPEKYRYDPTFKSKGCYIDIDIMEFIARMEREEIFDYYTATAYRSLVEKTKSFYKVFQKDVVSSFLDSKLFDEIVVIGHSCKIDYECFQYLKEKYPNVKWIFNPHTIEDIKNINNLIKRINLSNYFVNNIM